MAKLTEVALKNTANNTTEKFEINHAERILRMPNNGGWQLPKNSPFKFDFKNGIGFKQDTGDSEESEETNNDQ